MGLSHCSVFLWFGWWVWFDPGSIDFDQRFWCDGREVFAIRSRWADVIYARQVCANAFLGWVSAQQPAGFQRYRPLSTHIFSQDVVPTILH
ncbi:hypothetical protein V1279_003042 [Bradyrhizobium sp. AZCC 1610]|uniref:hypothetical protein n=1 Tax=Bradyrhizobium sp. AZCC 1610 TaxID=3117020 RepID=UPI002FF2B405